MSIWHIIKEMSSNLIYFYTVRDYGKILTFTVKLYLESESQDNSFAI